MQRRSELKERFWRKLIGGFEAAGGSVRSWCESHGVSEPSFYAWRRDLARRDRATAESRTSRFVPVRVESAAPAVAASSDAEVTLLLPSGLRLQTSVTRLAAVLDVLEARSC